MDPLSYVSRGSLYNWDTSFLANVGYQRESVRTALFYFSEQPDFEFPLTVSFKPSGEEYTHISYIYTLTEAKEGVDDLGDRCFVVSGTSVDVPELREDIRVNVSFPIDIHLENAPFDENYDRRVLLTDISAGGFMFVSKDTFDIGSVVSFMFSFKRTPAYITGIIRHERPTRTPDLKGYGCQFTGLSSATESMIRSFVFQEEAIQRRKIK